MVCYGSLKGLFSPCECPHHRLKHHPSFTVVGCYLAQPYRTWTLRPFVSSQRQSKHYGLPKYEARVCNLGGTWMRMCSPQAWVIAFAVFPWQSNPCAIHQGSYQVRHYPSPFTLQCFGLLLYLKYTVFFVQSQRFESFLNLF